MLFNKLTRIANLLKYIDFSFINLCVLIKYCFCMNLIKLNAIPSTNDYLKEISSNVSLKNFTVVVADNQTNGKGQMGTNWNVEPNSNLTFSILIKNERLDTKDIFFLNVITANSVLSALKSYNLDEIYIKWPNDILSYNKKIAGILIENNFKSDIVSQSIIGIGINLSQKNFDNLPKASSILNNYGIELDKMELLDKIVNCLKVKLSNFNSEEEWSYYHTSKICFLSLESGKSTYI